MTAFRSGNRRRRYFVKKDFQTRFILKFCIPIALTALISAVVLYRFSGQGVVTVFENSRLVIKSGTEFIAPGLVLSILVSVFLVGAASAGVLFFVSHRIAGPLHKTEESLMKMGRGDLGFDINLRRGDEAKKLADSFNSASRGLSGLVGGLKEEHSRMYSAVRRLEALAGDTSGLSEDLKKAVKDLSASAAALGKKLDKFKIR